MAATRRICAVLVFVVMGILLTAGVAAAHDYPPTTSAVKSQSQSATPAAAASTGSSSAGLPFTGGNDAALAMVGLAVLGAGGLLVVRTRRRSHA
jgi:LPXTG-motif cell wall-anchored protein